VSDRKKLPESEVANSIRKRVGKNSLRYRPIYPRCQMPSRRFFGKFLRFSRTPARHHKPLDFSGLRLSPGDVPGVFPGLEQISNVACCPCWFQYDPREFESRPGTGVTKVHLHGARHRLIRVNQRDRARLGRARRVPGARTRASCAMYSVWRTQRSVTSDTSAEFASLQHGVPALSRGYCACR